MTVAWPGPPVVVRVGGLALREWRQDDVEVMVGLFDTDEVNRRTPLPSPFDMAAASRYVTAAHRARRDSGALQLAITERESPPLGEVLAFPAGSTVELAYVVGAAHRGRGLGRRAVAAVLQLAAAGGAERAELRIADDNLPSQRLAAATGFALTADPYLQRSRKGQVVQLATWRQSLHCHQPQRQPKALGSQPSGAGP